MYSVAFAAHLCSKDFLPLDLDLMVKRCLLVFVLQIALATYFAREILDEEIQEPLASH